MYVRWSTVHLNNNSNFKETPVMQYLIKQPPRTFGANFSNKMYFQCVFPTTFRLRSCSPLAMLLFTTSTTGDLAWPIFRAVSIPAPVYYAHLAATRAKDYIKARVYDGESSGSISSGDMARHINDFAFAQRVCQEMKQQMYFVWARSRGRFSFRAILVAQKKQRRMQTICFH